MGLNVIINTCKGLPNEQQCRFNLSKIGAVPRFTYADIFWIPGSEAIRCHTFEGMAVRLTFCVHNSQIFVTLDGFDLLTPKDLARKIAEPMTLRVLR